jgi:hypothetical protein
MALVMAHVANHVPSNTLATLTSDHYVRRQCSQTLPPTGEIVADDDSIDCDRYTEHDEKYDDKRVSGAWNSPCGAYTILIGSRLTMTSQQLVADDDARIEQLCALPKSGAGGTHGGQRVDGDRDAHAAHRGPHEPVLSRLLEQHLRP